MFGLIKKVFVVAMTLFWLQCIECKCIECNFIEMCFNEQSRM